MEISLTLYYIAFFVAAMIVSLVFTRSIRDGAIRRGWLDKARTGRHFHLSPVPRIGGVSIFLSFVLVTGIALGAYRLQSIHLPLPTQTVLGIILPASLIFLLGLCDDKFSLGPYVKFGVQAVAAVWLYLAGFGIHRLAAYSSHDALGVAIGLPLTIFWVLLITNAFNLIDGLDGLAAGSALFSTMIIFAVSLFRHTPLVSLLSVVLAGAIFGFLRYNFHPATIFLGDSGSLFIGFLLSALALASSQKSTTAIAVAIPVVAFGLPLLDVCISVIRRFMNNKPLFLGDDDHVHHKLLKRGLSHRDAVLVLYAVAAAFGLLSLTLLHDDIRVGFVLLLIGLGVWLGVQQLKYVEVYELGATARRIWRRKRIIANNLQIRRAIESFSNNTLEFPELCRILQATLDPSGFCGISVSFPQIDYGCEASLFPLRRVELNKYSHFWLELDLKAPEWELKLELTSSSGNKLADFYLFRKRASEPLLVDMSLIGDEFRTSISGIVDRAIVRIIANRTEENTQRILAMKMTSEDSKPELSLG
jgi:UDP-GlcNAc:undecaprenyl-phosphate GlcNAc-1-phosphate transferase